eukprot:6356789-Amphidinium_carterae.2
MVWMIIPIILQNAHDPRNVSNGVEPHGFTNCCMQQGHRMTLPIIEYATIQQHCDTFETDSCPQGPSNAAETQTTTNTSKGMCGGKKQTT